MAFLDEQTRQGFRKLAEQAGTKLHAAAPEMSKEAIDTAVGEAVKGATREALSAMQEGFADAQRIKEKAAAKADEAESAKTEVTPAPAAPVRPGAAG